MATVDEKSHYVATTETDFFFTRFITLLPIMSNLFCLKGTVRTRALPERKDEQGTKQLKSLIARVLFIYIDLGQ